MVKSVVVTHGCGHRSHAMYGDNVPDTDTSSTLCGKCNMAAKGSFQCSGVPIVPCKKCGSTVLFKNPGPCNDHNPVTPSSCLISDTCARAGCIAVRNSF